MGILSYIIIIIIIILFNYISTTNIITGKIVEKNSWFYVTLMHLTIILCLKDLSCTLIAWDVYKFQIWFLWFSLLPQTQK